MRVPVSLNHCIYIFPKFLQWQNCQILLLFLYIHMGWLEVRRVLLYFLNWIHYARTERWGLRRHKFSGSQSCLHFRFTQEISKIPMLKPYHRPIKAESPWGYRQGDVGVGLIAPPSTLGMKIPRWPQCAVSVGNYCPCIWLIRERIKPEWGDRYLAVNPSLKGGCDLECIPSSVSGMCKYMSVWGTIVGTPGCGTAWGQELQGVALLEARNVGELVCSELRTELQL